MIPHLGRSDGPDPPAGNELLSHEGASYALGMRSTCNLRKETVSRIGGAHPAEAFLAIQGQGIGRQLRTPKRLRKPLPSGLAPERPPQA